MPAESEFFRTLIPLADLEEVADLEVVAALAELLDFEGRVVGLAFLAREFELLPLLVATICFLTAHLNSLLAFVRQPMGHAIYGVSLTNLQPHRNTPLKLNLEILA